GLVLATWNPADPAWSHSVHATTTMNRGGTLGAYISDFLLFLFGYSAWLWVVLLAQRVILGFYRLTHILVTNNEAPLPRLHWEVGIGFFLLSIGAMGTEALQMKQCGAHLPAGAGGQLGQLLASGMALAMGTTGCTILLLVFVAVGASLFFGFSWLHLSERVGLAIEQSIRRVIDFKTARDDRKVGQVKKAERDETVVAKQEKLVHEQPVRIEPAITTVPKSVRVEKEKQKTLFTATVEGGGSGDLPAISLLDMPVDNLETVSPETIEYTSRSEERRVGNE